MFRCGYISFIVNISECYNRTNSSYCLWLPDLYSYCSIVILLIIAFCWQCRSPDERVCVCVGGEGGGGGPWGPYPSPAFSGSTLPGWYPENSLLCHSPKYVRMSALPESRQRPCISYLDFLINTYRILLPQEDIRNDPHVIWFEAATRGILVERKDFDLLRHKNFS